MKKKYFTKPVRRSLGEGGFFNLRALLGLTLCLSGVALAIFAGKDAVLRPAPEPGRYMAVPGASSESEAAGLEQLEQYWHDRLTFPTGRFDPAWVRAAAAQHARMMTGVPAGQHLKLNIANPNALSTTNFTSLGPQPARMTGCSGCFNYTTTEGRVNAIAIDPTTTTNGSIVAYVGPVGGGVWKTTNCCSDTTTWTAVTDDPLIATTAIDTITIDPSNHNTVYAGTGDLNFGSFAMGSQGILKSTDEGATWTVLGADVFGMIYEEPPGQFPQYNAVGKVRVDPNNSNNVVAGTKQGLYFSYDGGADWTGPCFTNNFSTQRQDVTGLELSDMGGGTTRVVAAIGTRGFATPVQYDLGNNGANGLYSAIMGSSGCPSFTSITSNANGFIFGNQVTGSAYPTGAPMNAGTGSAFVNTTTGNQLGRIDIGVAPGNPNYIYAQGQSITPNSNGGCGNTNGCQIGAWATTDGGATWSFMEGSQGGSLRDCEGGAGDYPQNWYDQGVAVDPNNPERVFFDTFDVWFATRTGTVWNDTTCGYSYNGSAGPVHVDQHALAFLPGSSSILAIGNDGGIHGTTNADITSDTMDPTWFNMDNDISTIEFYSGDISGNFANAGSPQANGGSQDNASSSVTFTGTPTGPVLWQVGVGGDGFYGRIDPVGTGSSLRFWQGNNSGALHRCVSNCTNQNAPWSGRVSGGWSGDTQSFILPYDLFHGGIPGGDDCPPAGVPGGCGNLIAGTTRVWETIHGGNSTFTSSDWYVTNNPTTQNMTKQTLGNRSYINQLKYSPKYQSVAMVCTNDANVWIGFNLGTGIQSQANWVDVTGNNTVLPLRPVQGIALDPTVSAANLPVGYAAVGGFNANTPSSPGHVFQVTCAADCGSFTWVDKTGNLPDIPVDSIIVNPNIAQQVYAGTDWGVYYTDDITVASPTWLRFENGISHAMVWDMQIDRGATTLSVWTRSRGAYVYPLPGSASPTPTPTGTPSPTPTATATVPATATPTATASPTPTATPSATPTPTCQVTYTTATSTGTITAGGTDTGNHCDDCDTQIDLPFPVSVYGTATSVATVGSDGDIQFTGTPSDKVFFWDGCVPVDPDPSMQGPFLNTLFPNYADLRTDENPLQDCSDCGIFTQTLGTPPNRQFVIRWKATYFNFAGTAEFQVVLTEGSNTLSVIYGTTADNGLTAVSGIQQDLNVFTSFSCDEATLTPGLRVDYIPTSCGSPTPSPTPTATATPTPIRTSPTPRPRPTPPPRP
jgi:hypothetical protein